MWTAPEEQNPTSPSGLYTHTFSHTATRPFIQRQVPSTELHPGWNSVWATLLDCRRGTLHLTFVSHGTETCGASTGGRRKRRDQKFKTGPGYMRPSKAKEKETKVWASGLPGCQGPESCALLLGLTVEGRASPAVSGARSARGSMVHTGTQVPLK